MLVLMGVFVCAAGDDSFVANGTVSDVTPTGLAAEGSSYIFPSEEVHRVTNVTSGQRKVLVVEVGNMALSSCFCCYARPLFGHAGMSTLHAAP